MEAITFLYKEVVKKMTGVRLLWGSPDIPEGSVTLKVRLRGRGSGRDFMFQADFSMCRQQKYILNKRLRKYETRALHEERSLLNTTAS